MGAAAQLNGEIARADNAHDIAVLLAEQSHCAELLRLFNGHLACLDRNTLEDDLVDLALYRLELIARESGEMGEVEAHFLAVDKLSRLLNVAAEVLSEGCLEQMSRGVVAAGCFALFNIYLSADLIAESDTVSAYEFCDMEYDSVGGLARSGDLERRVFGSDNARVARLSAALAIERGLVEHNNHLGVSGCELVTLAVCDYRLYLGVAGIIGIADKLGRADILERNVAVLPRLSSGILARRTRRRSALSIEAVILVDINAHAALFEQLFCQVNREAESILKLESICAAEHLGIALSDNILKQIETCVYSLIEALFLSLDDLYNKVVLLDEVRIGCCILFDNGLAHFVEESAVDT